jgi:hypothetical protein
MCGNRFLELHEVLVFSFMAITNDSLELDVIFGMEMYLYLHILYEIPTMLKYYKHSESAKLLRLYPINLM